MLALIICGMRGILRNARARLRHFGGGVADSVRGIPPLQVAEDSDVNRGLAT